MTRDLVRHVSDRWFRLLLRLYPIDFREELGDAVVEAYCERVREARHRGGLMAVVRIWLSALIDSLRNGLAERVRPAAVWRRSSNWGRDLELARRRLARAPMFVAATMATLTVGLGTFAVVFTAVDKILLEPLPYDNSRDLYVVWSKTKELTRLMVSGPAIAEFRKGDAVIEDAAGLQTGTVTVSADAAGEALRVEAIASSANLFDLLGVRPALGRGFQPDEEGPNAPNVAVLSDGLWRRLGSDSSIIGEELSISRSLYTVIGVMPPDFRFSPSYRAINVDVFVPFDFALASRNPNGTSLRALIRARHGATDQQVQQAVDAVGRAVLDPATGGLSLYAVGFHADLVRFVRPALLALSVAVAVMVLVLAVNLASLLLARAADREREYAVSRALGANGPAIVRAALLEGGLLGLCGGMTGALAGVWGTRLFLAMTPVSLPRREMIALDANIAVVVIGAGLLLGLVAGAAPATWAARVSVSTFMARTAARGAARSGRMRRGLIVVQVALSLVLLNTGAVVVRSFERLLSVDAGFSPEGVLTFRVGVSDGVFQDAAAAHAFQDELEAVLRALPGVTAVSATSRLPLSGGGDVERVIIPKAEGNTGDPERDQPAVLPVYTRGGYVAALGMRVLDGRGFDISHRTPVPEALIDRHLARQFFPSTSPIGATALVGNRELTIVGVVDQARLFELHEDDPNPQLFIRAENAGRFTPFYVVRTQQEPNALISMIPSLIRNLDPRVPLSDIRTLEDIVADGRSQERISAVMISALGLGALLLVAMGLSGVTSGSVTRRRGELAVRIALGATHQRVLRLVMGEGTLLVGVGVLLGLPAVYAAGGLVRGVLVGVSPWDPLSLMATVCGLALVAVAACYVPARRVLRLDPAPLLRQE
jgi:putative ABC transport system permease protein